MAERVALVTGGSRGIGRAISLALARGGHRVVVNYRERADDAKQTRALIEEAGGEAICVQADVGDGEQTRRMFSEIEDAFGPVDVLVNNAGTRRDKLAISMSDDDWHGVVTTNLFGTFACSRRALRAMVRERWGRIVNVASISGLHGNAGQANYAAAKAGVIALTKTMAREVGSKNITVNAVAPGLVVTDLTSDLGEERLEELLRAVPTGRAATAEEVASLVAYLVGDLAACINGSVFVIDGGATA